MRKKLAVLIALILALSLINAPSNAAVKAGAKCTKAGATANAAGKKFTCVRSGNRLVWNKGVAFKAATKPKLNPVFKPAEPTPMPTPLATPTPTPTVKADVPFMPWSTDTTAKAVSDAAQVNFRNWAEAQIGKVANHKFVLQENVLDSRKKNFQRVDAIGTQLFGQFFSVPSATVVGSSESWVVEKLNSNGGSYRECSDNAGNSGLNYCLDQWKTQGYVVTEDMGYDATNPGNDGTSLLAHEYFHLVQHQLVNLERQQLIRDGYKNSEHLFPAWFIEGSANFVGFSVSALTFSATYWEGRKAMFTYAPQGLAVNSLALEDYEIRNGPGNYSPTYPYITGQLATEYLVASAGFEKTLNIWIQFRESKDFKKSFEKAIGISIQDFYRSFEAVRTDLGLPPVTHKLICLTTYRLSEVPSSPGPCALDRNPNQGTPNPNPPGNPPPPPPPPPGSEPPPIDRTSNVDGLGCRYREADLVNGFGTFVCTETAGGNNFWRRKS
jgi:hypothetical protein